MTNVALKNSVEKFSSRKLAFDYSNRTVKPSRVMLGCDGKFWVVTPADAQRLEAAGYEFA